MILNKIIQGTFPIDFFIFQQVSQYLQKMRFATTKEAADPNAHVICIPSDALFICTEEPGEMLLQFPRYDILFQFLLNIRLLLLTNLNNTFYFTGNGFGKHFLDDHCHILLNLPI